MKILTVKNALKAAAIALSTSAAMAVSLTDANVVGTVSKDAPADAASDVTYINNLLGLTVATPPLVTIDGHIYQTANPGFSGAVSETGDLVVDSANTSVPAGYDVVIAKYGNDGIVFFLNQQPFTLPASIQGIFPPDNPNNPNAGDNGGGLSDYRAYIGVPNNPVIPPEGFPTPDGGATMLLLGGGISALAALRRKLS